MIGHVAEAAWVLITEMSDSAEPGIVGSSSDSGSDDNLELVWADVEVEVAGGAREVIVIPSIGRVEGDMGELLVGEGAAGVGEVGVVNVFLA